MSAHGAGLFDGALREARPLLALTAPIVAGLATSTLVSVVDTVMVAPLGTIPLAAVALTTSALILFYSAIYGLLGASGVRVAERIAAGAAGEARAALRAGLVLAAASSALAAGAMLALRAALPLLNQPAEVIAIIGPYWTVMAITLIPWAASIVLIGALSAADRAWLGCAVGVGQLALNVPLNVLLIYEAGLGLLGAGLASLLATALSLPLAALFLRRTPVGAAGGRTAPLAPEVSVQWRAGWPMAVGFTAEGGGYAVAGLMLGGLGAAALAANQIVQSVTGVLYMIPLGLATATALRVGDARGRGGAERLRPILLAAVLLVSGWMAAILNALVVGREPLARAFTADEEVVAIAAALFLVLALMQVFDGVQSAAMGALRGLFDTRWAMVATVIGYWVVALPAAWALAYRGGFGAPGIWLGYAIGVALAAIALPWRFWRLTR